MSKPRYRWWGYVKNVIRAYPDLKQQYEELHSTTITASYSGTGGGRSSDVNDPTMKAAIRSLPKQEQKEYEAVNAAAWVTKRYPNGDKRLEIIRLMYWEKNCSYYLVGAGEVVGYKEAQAKELHRAFIMLVADFLGMI